MRFLILASVAALAACANPTPQQLHTMQVACAVDGAVQPIAAATLAVAVPASAPAVSADTLLAHPAVVAYCANLGGTPIVQAQAVAATVTASPVATSAAVHNPQAAAALQGAAKAVAAGVGAAAQVPPAAP